MTSDPVDKDVSFIHLSTLATLLKYTRRCPSTNHGFVAMELLLEELLELGSPRSVLEGLEMLRPEGAQRALGPPPVEEQTAEGHIAADSEGTMEGTTEPASPEKVEPPMNSSTPGQALQPLGGAPQPQPLDGAPQPLNGAPQHFSMAGQDLGDRLGGETEGAARTVSSGGLDRSRPPPVTSYYDLPPFPPGYRLSPPPPVEWSPRATCIRHLQMEEELAYLRRIQIATDNAAMRADLEMLRGRLDLQEQRELRERRLLHDRIRSLERNRSYWRTFLDFVWETLSGRFLASRTGQAPLTLEQQEPDLTASSGPGDDRTPPLGDGPEDQHDGALV